MLKKSAKKSTSPQKEKVLESLLCLTRLKRLLLTPLTLDKDSWNHGLVTDSFNICGRRSSEESTKACFAQGQVTDLDGFFQQWFVIRLYKAIDSPAQLNLASALCSRAEVRLLLYFDVWLLLYYGNRIFKSVKEMSGFTGWVTMSYL